MANDMAKYMDPMARAIFAAALVEDRCGELLCALFENGSATVDRDTGKLLILTADQLSQLTDNSHADSYAEWMDHGGEG